MSDEILNSTDASKEIISDDPTMAADEIVILKQRARLMGVTFSNNIGLEALRAKVKAAQEAPEKSVVDSPPVSELVDPSLPNVGTSGKKLTLREQLNLECLKLIRVRITNLDPKKKDLPGEIFTVGNEVIGTVTKYIPYGEVTDEGYHLPMIIYNNLKERKFLDIRTTKDRKTDKIRVEQRWAQEFAFEVLPQLTPEELERLRLAQAAAGGV
jgi:hypothetical protein